MESNDHDPNIEDVVSENRGIIKKLQLLIPGFRAYRMGDDLRVADALLRKQVSSNLQNAMNNLKMARSRMAQEGDFQDLTSIGSALSELQQLDGEILHSAQGYTGISPSIRIDDTKLKDLYQYDYSFLDSASSLEKSSDISGYVDSNDIASIQKQMRSVQDFIAATRINWEKRIETVEKIVLK